MIDRSKLSNSFELVVTAGARARQLLVGSTPRVAVGEHKKTTIAQQEVVTRRWRSFRRMNWVIAEAIAMTRLPDYPITTFCLC